MFSSAKQLLLFLLLACEVAASEDEPGRYLPEDGSFWVYAGISLSCVLFAGIMSGLTLGLLSLDVTKLTILINAGSADESRRARAIKPVVERHHHLLVTLLLCNAAAMEGLPLFLSKIANEWVSLILSVTLVLMFGEVVPQAVCSRYGLAIGASMAPFVACLMFITSPLTLPLAKILDVILGHDESGMMMRRGELKELIKLHVGSQASARRQSEHTHLTEAAEAGSAGNVNSSAGAGSDDGAGGTTFLTYDEYNIIQGALDVKGKSVSQPGVLTCLEHVFSIPLIDAAGNDTVMDYDLMQRLMDSGFSRVPVRSGKVTKTDGAERADKFLGMLLVKKLIQINPSDRITVKSILWQCDPITGAPARDLQDGKFMFNRKYGSRSIPSVTDDMLLLDLLAAMSGRQHNAVYGEQASFPAHLVLVHSAKTTEVIGIVTLEDIIEAIMLTEILDETDVFEDVNIPSSKLVRSDSSTAPKAGPLSRSSTSRFRIADCPSKPGSRRTQLPAFQSSNVSQPTLNTVTTPSMDDDDQSTSLLENAM